MRVVVLYPQLCKTIKKANTTMSTPTVRRPSRSIVRGSGADTRVSPISTQPLATGLLAAVFTRVMIKQRPMAVAQAVMMGQKGSKFDGTPKGAPPGVGRME